VKRLGSRLVYENPWMRVREDSVALADGSTGIYGVVEKPDCVLLVPIDGSSVFMVEQYRYPVGGRFLEFPQGSWEEERDTSPAVVARGELEEETGLTAGSLTQIGFMYLSYGYARQGMHVFLASDLVPGNSSPSLEETGLQTREVTIQQLRDLIRGGEIVDAATLAAFAVFEEHRRSGRARPTSGSR
jgi:8-oxo-dGTP pyrophosphatase MutT (NUDIX family)